ncbi:hypothetical protein ACSMX9_16195 [Streptomyces sp. LE64]
MSELLVGAAQWIGRGIWIALDLLNLYSGAKDLRDDVRRHRRRRRA